MMFLPADVAPLRRLVVVVPLCGTQCQSELNALRQFCQEFLPLRGKNVNDLFLRTSDVE
jgi:hypothetical protein